MPAVRDDELPEYVFRGPFGGIQSEVSSEQINNTGFYDAQNVVFRKSSVYNRPPINALPGIPNPQEAILGVADFFTATGIRLQVILTRTRLLQWNGNTQSWTPIVVTGGPFTGGSTQNFTWDVLAGKLCFSQGVDKVWMWDGTNPAVVAAAGAPIGKYLFELDRHMLVMNCIVAGTPAPQRVFWSGIGDITDWTSFNAGQVDLFNNLGPINNGCKLLQQGYIFHQWGITQAILTGVGTAPFAFIPMTSKAKGLIAPYSLASFGDLAGYVGKSNIYLFDGTSSTPIGDRPIDGNRRLGARKRIFADLLSVGPNLAYGFMSTSINGRDFEAYWLLIPGLRKAWIYSMVENNWTQAYFEKFPQVMGVFDSQSVLRIQDLIGTIGVQTWSPSTLNASNPLDSVFVGFNDGTPTQIDFTGNCEQTCLVQSGQLNFEDARHEHSVKKVRVVVEDLGATSFTLQLTNQLGQTAIKNVSYGTGTGAQLTIVVPFSLVGQFITFTLTVAAGLPFGMSEISPIYDIAGEIKCPTNGIFSIQGI